MKISLEINSAEHGGFFVQASLNRDEPYMRRSILFAGSLDEVFGYIRGAYDAQAVAKPATSSPDPKPVPVAANPQKTDVGSVVKPPVAKPVAETKPAEPPPAKVGKPAVPMPGDVDPAPAPTIAEAPKQSSAPLDISILPDETEVLRELQQKTLLTKIFVAAIWGVDADRNMTALIAKMRTAKIFIRVVMLQGWKVDSVDRKRLGSLIDEMTAPKAAAE